MAEEIVVSAAASLTEAFTAIGKAWGQAEKGRVVVRFNFAASGALVQQIVAGAPADVFAAASPLEMDQLAAQNKIERASRRNFATNRLVLIMARVPASPLKGWQDLALPTVHQLVISNPAFVPAGRYTRATLEKRGLWKAVQPKLVLGENVRQTLTYAANGDADAGIVYRTDAQSEKRVRIVAEAVPGRDHEPILYPAAVVLGSAHADAARRFVAFLGSHDAQQILTHFGFGLPPKS